MKLTGEASGLPDDEQQAILAMAAAIGVPAAFLAAIRIAENGTLGRLELTGVISDTMTLCVSSAGSIQSLREARLDAQSAGIVYVLSDEDSITKIQRSIGNGNAQNIRTIARNTLSVQEIGARRILLTFPSEKKSDTGDGSSYLLSGLSVVPVDAAHAVGMIETSLPFTFTTWIKPAKNSTFLAVESALKTLKPLSQKQTNVSYCVLIATPKSINNTLVHKNLLTYPSIIQMTSDEEILIGECTFRGCRAFGVLSESAGTYEAQCRIAALSIRNNQYRYVLRFKEWPVDGHGGLSEAFTKFMAARWAPVGVENDPTSLNQHWPRNVWRAYQGSGIGSGID